MKTSKEEIEALYQEAVNRLRDCKPPFDERAKHHSALFDMLREMRDIALNAIKEREYEPKN
jgi:hypothetical protein